MFLLMNELQFNLLVFKVIKGHHHHNQLDVDAPSSSLMDLPPLSSSLAGNESTISNSAQREFDSDGVEIVRFHQVAQVEHHRPSASWSSSGGEEAASSTGGCTISLTPQHHHRQYTDLVSASKSSAHRGSIDSNSSGSATIEEVFNYESRCRRQQQAAKQSLSSKHSGESSASIPASNCSSTNQGEVARRPSRRESGAASHASLECLDGPSNHAQDVFLPSSAMAPPPRQPFVSPSSAGDRAQASASELEPLSGCCADEDFEKGAGEGLPRDLHEYRTGILLTKFPMETGL